MPAVLNPSTEAGETRGGGTHCQAVRVTMLDLASIVPYYTGHLCTGLREVAEVQVALASVTYQHDPQFFRRRGLRNDPGALDVMSKLRVVPAPLRRSLKLVEYCVNLAALLLRSARSRPDIVHVQFLPLMPYLPVELWFLKLARRLGTRIVYTVHNVLPQDSGDRHKSIYREAYQLASRLICHDVEASARLVSEFGIDAERIAVIPHGPLFADTAWQAPSDARARLGVAPEECLILWQGIVRPYKGVSFLLRSWRQVCAHEPNARLVIAGTGDSECVRAVKDEVRELGLESRVRLELRFIPIDELAGYYHAADVLVYPYREITTSGALMTGIAFGKAIVSSDLPAFRNLLQDGVNALLVRYDDTEAMAASLLRLIRDRSLRARLGERVREIGLPEWADIAQQTCECYRAALGE
ncbi:MAG: glycosyltransferase [Acidobacteria bacterium]|nr:glycosyltransferase [Acidobacteriota bacterium]